MKQLIMMILLCCMSGLAAATNCPPNSNNPNCYPETDYPGNTPNWTQRFTIGCTMENNDTGEMNAMFAHGSLDYAQGGSLFAYLNAAVTDWYNDLRELAGEAGFDTRLVPSLDDPLGQIIGIEKALAE